MIFLHLCGRKIMMAFEPWGEGDKKHGPNRVPKSKRQSILMKIFKARNLSIYSFYKKSLEAKVTQVLMSNIVL